MAVDAVQVVELRVDGTPLMVDVREPLPQTGDLLDKGDGIVRRVASRMFRYETDRALSSLVVVTIATTVP